MLTDTTNDAMLGHTWSMLDGPTYRRSMVADVVVDLWSWKCRRCSLMFTQARAGNNPMPKLMPLLEETPCWPMGSHE
jgi:hypothetical protein